MTKLLALTLALAGCGKANLGGGDDVADAPSGSGSDGSMQDGPGMPDTPAAACASGRKVFLNFEGVTLSDDATSDAPTNKARWLTPDGSTSVVPAWRAGSGTRAAEIVAVTNGVKSRLSTTPIEVVTTRPSAGTYVMIVLGGNSTLVGGTVASAYTGAVSYHDCSDVTKNDVGWIADLDGQTTDFVANFVVGAIGWGLGLDGADSTTDCMCGWANACQPDATACTLANNAASSITASGESACTAGMQNERTAFETSFCQ